MSQRRVLRPRQWSNGRRGVVCLVFFALKGRGEAIIHPHGRVRVVVMCFFVFPHGWGSVGGVGWGRRGKKAELWASLSLALRAKESFVKAKDS